jgi:hypothetical protein
MIISNIIKFGFTLFLVVWLVPYSFSQIDSFEKDLIEIEELFLAGDFENAIFKINVLIELVKRDNRIEEQNVILSKCHFWLGLCNLATGNYEGAEIEFKNVLRFDPQFVVDNKKFGDFVKTVFASVKEGKSILIFPTIIQEDDLPQQKKAVQIEESQKPTRQTRTYSLGLGGGISKVIGEGSEFWKIGYTFSGSGYFHLSQSVLLGVRFAYNNWAANEEEYTGGLDVTGMNLDISGSTRVIELTPSIRFVTPLSKSNSIKFLGHAGFGLFLLKVKSTMKFDLGDGFNQQPFSQQSAESSESKLGFNIGGGIIFGENNSIQFEVLPLYNIVLTEGDTFNYFSLSLGINFGK